MKIELKLTKDDGTVVEANFSEGDVITSTVRCVRMWGGEMNDIVGYILCNQHGPEILDQNSITKSGDYLFSNSLTLAKINRNQLGLDFMPIRRALLVIEPEAVKD